MKSNIYAHVIQLNFSCTVLITHKYYVLHGNFNTNIKTCRDHRHEILNKIRFPA